jgi:hypothetical protein
MDKDQKLRIQIVIHHRQNSLKSAITLILMHSQMDTPTRNQFLIEFTAHILTLGWDGSSDVSHKAIPLVRACMNSEEQDIYSDKFN